MKLHDTKDQIDARDASMCGSSFVDVDLSDARFDDVRLAGARLRNVSLCDVTIEDADITGLRINGVLISDLFAPSRGGAQ